MIPKNANLLKYTWLMVAQNQFKAIKGVSKWFIRTYRYNKNSLNYYYVTFS